MKGMSITLIFGCLWTLGSQAEDYRRTLISVEANQRIEDWILSSNDLPFKTQTEISVEKKTLHGGKQEGVEVIHVDNGRLRITVIPTRGMGIYEVVLDDIRLGWDSPVKEIVHPSFVDLNSRGGLGWLEGFNEWLPRCGLEWAGHPGQDRFINNVGDEATMDLTLHGKVANIPASEVEVVVDETMPHTIRIRGRVDERSFYGPQLELWTEVSTAPGSDRFTLSDTLTNRGAESQEFQMLYHANFGPPLLEEGSQLVAPIDEITPFNFHAAQSIETAPNYGPPTPGFVEQVYCMKPLGNLKGQTTVLLKNAQGNRGASMTFGLAQLPYLTQWKNSSPLESGYVTGIEPGTGYPSNRRIEREQGRVPKLNPGESRHFQIDFSILTSEESVNSTLKIISAIQAARQPKVNSIPLN